LKQRLETHAHNEQIVRELMTKHGHHSQYDDLFKTVNRTLSIYEQRLGYINKRFLVLQTLFNRQLLTLSSKQHVTVSLQTDDEHYLDLSLLERELHTVTHERDLLVHKLEQEYEQTKKHAEQLEDKYKQDRIDVNSKLIVMQSLIDDNQTRIDAYERQLIDKDQRLKEITEKCVHDERQRTDTIDVFKRDVEVTTNTMKCSSIDNEHDIF
jgi:hypothetical protein